MAWQLIYTSAPRLLEAGRSGFGTVARHRDIPPLLVAAVERISQFSRQSGLDPARVIYAHRIILLSGQRYHVLSCIRDAGADYTGRTNHIAHHLIAEPQEVASLAISAADILLQMPWASTWTQAPRWLEPHETIPLASFPSSVGSRAAHWAAITGSARNAQLLVTGDAAHGCYVIAPSSVDLTSVFAESLTLDRDKRWQVAFTSSLQPSDESTDFKWLGMEANSPLRSACGSTGRIVLDLSQPQTLPSPTGAEPIATKPELKPASVPVPAEAPRSNSTRLPSPAPTQPVFKERWAKRNDVRAAGSSKQIPSTLARRPWMYALGCILLSGAVFAGVKAFRAVSLEKQRNIWFEQLPNFAKENEHANTAFSGLSWSNKDSVIPLDAAAQKIWISLKEGSIERLDSEPLRVAINDAEKASPPLHTPSHQRVLTVVATVIDRRQALKAPKPGESLELDTDLHKQITAPLFSGSNSNDGLQKTRDALYQLWLEREANGILKRLMGDVDPTADRARFEVASEALKNKVGSNLRPEQLKLVDEIIEDWKTVEVAKSRETTIPIKERWPGWLKIFSKSSGFVSIPGLPASDLPSAVPVKDEVTSKFASYISVGSGELASLRVNELNGNTRLSLVIGDNTSALRKLNNALYLEADVTKPVLELSVEERRIAAGMGIPTPPFKIVGKIDDSVAFKVLVLPEGNSDPVVRVHNLSIRRERETISVLGPLALLDNIDNLRWRLSIPPTLATAKSGTVIDLDAKRTANIKGLIKGAEERIVRLDEAAAEIRLRAKETSNTSSFDAIKEKANRYAAGLKGEGATAWKRFEQKTAQQVVGDLAKALSDEWDAGKGGKEVRFRRMRDCGEALGGATENKEAFSRNQELITEIQALLRSVKDGNKPVLLGNLESLANELKRSLDPTEPEKRRENLLVQAKEKESEAAALKADALMTPQFVPDGEYRLLARGLSERESLIAIIKVAKP